MQVNVWMPAVSISSGYCRFVQPDPAAANLNAVLQALACFSGELAGATWQSQYNLTSHCQPNIVFAFAVIGPVSTDGIDASFALVVR